jgi:hypothetical protein
MNPERRLKGVSKPIAIVGSLVAGIIFISLIYAAASGVIDQGVSQLIDVGTSNAPSIN